MPLTVKHRGVTSREDAGMPQRAERALLARVFAYLAPKRHCHQTARVTPWTCTLNLNFEQTENLGATPNQLEVDWHTHPCPCRETRSPLAASGAKPRAGSLSHFLQVPASAEAEQQGGSISSPFTAHSAGPGRLVSVVLPFSTQLSGWVSVKW